MHLKIHVTSAYIHFCGSEELIEYNHLIRSFLPGPLERFVVCWQLAHLDCVNPTKYYGSLLVMLCGPLVIGGTIWAVYALISRLPREGLHGREDCGRRAARLECGECSRLALAARQARSMCGAHAAALRGCRECVRVVSCSGAQRPGSEVVVVAAPGDACPLCGAALVCTEHEARVDGSASDAGGACRECAALRLTHEALRAVTGASTTGAAIVCAAHRAAALACQSCTLLRSVCFRHVEEARDCVSCSDTDLCAAHGATAGGCVSCRYWSAKNDADLAPPPLPPRVDVPAGAGIPSLRRAAPRLAGGPLPPPPPPGTAAAAVVSILPDRCPRHGAGRCADCVAVRGRCWLHPPSLVRYGAAPVPLAFADVNGATGTTAVSRALARLRLRLQEWWRRRVPAVVVLDGPARDDAAGAAAAPVGRAPRALALTIMTAKRSPNGQIWAALTSLRGAPERRAGQPPPPPPLCECVPRGISERAPPASVMCDLGRQQVFLAAYRARTVRLLYLVAATAYAPLASKVCPAIDV